MSSIFARSYHQRNPDKHLVLMVRDPTKVAPGTLPRESSITTYLPCEMTKLDQVRSTCKSLVEEIESGKRPRIENLICSATIQVTAKDQPRVTPDGYEETISVNHLAHFILLVELLPVMKRDARILIVGSASRKPDCPFSPLKQCVDPWQNCRMWKRGANRPKRVLRGGKGGMQRRNCCR